MAAVLAYWFATLLVAAIAWPLAARLFRRFPDGGAGLSLPLGLMLCGTIYFLLRTLAIVPAGRAGVIVVVVVMALVAVAFAGRDRAFLATARRHGPMMLAVVGLFSAAFFGYTAFRSYNAEIGGTEQPMDLLYLNAVVESESYPPEDPWLAGERASYYYFGYLQSGFLTSLSGVETSVSYNLSLAMVFAASAAAVCSLALALTRWALPRSRRALVPLGGAFGVVFLLLAGSLLGAFEFAAAHEQYNEPVYEALGAGSLLPCDVQPEAEDCYSGSGASPRTSSWYPDEFWFWWRSSRIIPGAITEFPAFSFVLGDLHPHLMAVPGVILAVAIAAATWRARGTLSLASYRKQPWLLPVLATVFGALAFQNTWDVLTFSALLAVAVVARNLRGLPPLEAARASLLFLLPAGALAVALFSPWWWFFSSQASGVYAYTGEGTRPAHALLQYGPLGIPALALFLGFRRWRPGWPGTAALVALWVPLLPAVVWLLLAVARGDGGTAMQDRGTAGWVTLLLLGAATWAFATAARASWWRRTPMAAPFALAALGALLIYSSEMLLVRDVFFGSVPRLNTVFKLTFQAWILLAIAAAVAVPVLVGRLRAGSSVAAAACIPVALVVFLSLFYVAGAIPNRTGGLGNTSNIDGFASLARNNPDEYALTRWIAENTEPGTVVIEATGRTWEGENEPEMTSGDVDYSDAGRIAARTGRPTPIGWYFHEVQWRGDTEENRQRFRDRQDDVDAIYLADDPEVVVETMRQYDADYLVVGSLERERYPAAAMPAFGQFLDLAFESGDLRIYRLPAAGTVPAS